MQDNNSRELAFYTAMRTHDRSLCPCAYCLWWRATWRERMAALRRRFWQAHDLIEDEESEVSTIVIEEDSSDELDQQ